LPDPRNSSEKKRKRKQKEEKSEKARRAENEDRKGRSCIPMTGWWLELEEKFELLRRVENRS